MGVGSAPIVGRVHIAQLKIGNTFFNCSFTVLDQPDMEFLFGCVCVYPSVIEAFWGALSHTPIYGNIVLLFMHDD